VLASLSHPNIAAIHSLEEEQGSRFLVLELVEGETLADRIACGPIPIDEALPIAKSICEGLEAAHEQGIVHRDLKPGNIKITPDGKVKVLDFGLAKAMESAPATTFSNSPTLLSVAASNAGMILGTAAYMSPEQAKGKSVDKRADIWAFGVVVYEMLTGKAMFSGETASETMAQVMLKDPDWNALPSNTSTRLPDLLRRCLIKDPRNRIRDMGDVRLELESIAANPDTLPEQATPLETRHSRKLLPAFILVLIVAIAIAAAIWHLQPSQAVRTTKFSITLPEGQIFTNGGRHLITISPDGNNIVYVANQQLYSRTLDDTEPRPIRGTIATPTTPFFSPDGRWIGFYSVQESKLKKVASIGGVAVTICDIDNPFGAVWDSNNQIYVGQGTKGIVRVPANGGKPETVVKLQPAESAHGPQLLRGGESLLFTLRTSQTNVSWDESQIVVQSLKTGERKVILTGGSDARYLPSGHLVYAVANAVFAVPFDVTNLETVGTPVPVLDGVSRPPVNNTGASHFGTSLDGTLVYVSGTSGAGTSLYLVDKAGQRKSLNIEPDSYSNPRVSPDGKKVTFNSEDPNDAAVWVYDLNDTTSPRRRLSFGGRDIRPLWTPDGSRIAFADQRQRDYAVFWQRADGTGTAEPLVKLEEGITAQLESWTPDGKTLIFTERTNVSQGIFTFTVGTDEKPKLLIPAPATNGSLSPDGKWFAYSTPEEGGRFEVFVQPFPSTGSKYQVTTTGGVSPVWAADQRQLFYLTSLRQIVQVDVQTKPTFVAGKATVLPIQSILNPGPRPYDITPDGKFFVVMLPKSGSDDGKPAAQQINVVLNWFEELKRHVPH
jgi:serine/threonine-protein kinase